METDTPENTGNARLAGRDHVPSVAAGAAGGNRLRRGGKEDGRRRVRFFLAGLAVLLAACSALVFFGGRIRETFESMINAGPGAEKPQYRTLWHDEIGPGGVEPSRRDNQKM